MDKGFGQGDPALARWAEETFAPEDALLTQIRARAAAAGLPEIAVGRMDGLTLEVLARAVGAKKAVELGTLAGYSGVCLLRGMGEGGFLHTFEYEPRHAAVATETFRAAGLAERVQIHVGAALERLREIEGEGPFDLVFVDADKTGYPRYLEWAEQHLKVGGVVLCDNAFAWGRVLRGGDPGVEAIATTNKRLGAGGRWRATMLPTAEGLALGVKLR
jgi:caffeoyl-CoA O-methyltransferase